MTLKALLITAALAYSSTLSAQYVVNNNAIAESCRCYTLTTANNYQRGSVWHSNVIDLTQNFDLKFNIFLGCSDAGADGMAFVLQRTGTNAIGLDGSGSGFVNITPSLGVLLDTYQNTDENDPVFDHISINKNGTNNHNLASNLAGPIQIVNGVDNIEDCNWHLLRIQWNAATTTLTTYVDGVQRVSTTNNIVNTIFGGNPIVYWGFTAGTGGVNNEQKFCTILDIQLQGLNGSDTLCFPSLLNYTANINATAPVVSHFWSMGDGTTYNTATINHNYAAPGVYTIKYSALGFDGCTSDTLTRQIAVGAVPTISINPIASNCAGTPTIVNTTVGFIIGTGNYSQFEWWLNNVAQPNTTSQNLQLNGLAAGNYTIKTVVKTNYGCVSDTAYANFVVYEKPANPSFVVNDVCQGSSVNLTSNTNNPNYQYGWMVDGIRLQNGASIQQVFATGPHTVKHFVYTTQGCTSDTITSSFNVYAYLDASFNYNDTCIGQPVTLSAATPSAAGITYAWSINGNNVSNQAQYTTSALSVGQYNVQLVLTNQGLCADTTTNIVAVFAKPAITSSAPTVCLGLTTQFTTLITNNVNVASWHWQFPNGSTSALQNPSITMAANGSYQAQLVAKSVNGCVSDTLTTQYVVTKINAYAGRDTFAVENIPILLTGVGNGTLYNWQPANLFTNPTAASSNATFNQNTHAVFTVRDAAGCVATDTVFVEVFKGINIYVPTVFSPNNDGVNDILLPKYLGIKQLHRFALYNRWGKEILNTSYTTVGWNGILRGKAQPSGVYVWYISATDILGKQHQLKGTVLLVR
jgi:gliding motility-associated-like protein